MRVAIVDDEQTMTDQIEKFLKRFQDESRVSVSTKVFHDAVSFVAEYDNSFDLILFDVEMPGMNGIEAAKVIRGKDEKVSIMFITNMAQYAIHGYEVEAIDYVLKPIGYQDFAMKMKKVMRYIRRDMERSLLLETSVGKISVKVSDILYIEVIRHYLNFYTTSGVYEVRGVMKEQEEMLQGFYFARCSQSFLVNLAHVKSIRGNIVCVGNVELSISRNKKNEFINAFTRYVGGM